MSKEAAKVSVSKERVGEFSAWSNKQYEQKLDAAKNRNTLFRELTSLQLLSLIAVDEIISGTTVDSGQCVRIKAQFHAAITPDTAYDVSVQHEHASNLFDAKIADEEGAERLTVQWSYGVPATLSNPAAWFGSVTTETSDVSEHLEKADEKLAEGAQFSNIYPAVPQHFNAHEGLLSEAQRRILALCSYVISVDTAGHRSLLTGLNIEFLDTSDLKRDDSLAYRALVKRFDSESHMLDLALEVCGPDGSIVARGEISTYVRGEQGPSSINAIREAVAAAGSLQNLSGQVAVVTGASDGLGADTASALSLAGCMVYAGCLHRTAQVEELEASLQAAGANIEFIIGDVGEQAWCDALRARLDEEQQRIGLLVLNACESPTQRLLGAAPGEGLDYISRNLRLLAQPLGAFLPDLHAVGGALIAISSEQVTNGQRGLADYVTLKHASESLAQGAYDQSGNISLLIARPPALRDSWNDSPTAIGKIIPVLQAAIAIVRGCDKSLEGTEVGYLESFPELVTAKGDQPPTSLLSPLPLTLCCSFTADPFLPAIERWAALAGRQAVSTVAPYHQVLQQLLDPGSILATSPGQKVLFLRHSDWLRERSADELDSIDFLTKFLNELTDELIQAFDAYFSRANEKLFLFLCPWFDKSEVGESDELTNLLGACESRLVEALATRPGIHLIQPASWDSPYGIDADAIFDPLRNEIGHIPYQTAYYDALASMMIRMIHAEARSPIKVVVVDCDNTLWDGVVGEVGPEGVHFQSQHLALQKRLGELTDAGVLVALCSKNEEADVWSAFEQRGSEMPLQREQIVGAMINWQPKSLNIQTLAAQLNLGLDSFAFLDDNPVECAEVRANCPEVLTLRWPTNAEEALIFVDHVWELDVPTSTAEDRKRTEMYKQEFKRQVVRDEAQSFDKFIESLGLEIDVRPLDEADIPRASQLTTRTNQFNFTTRRRDEAEMRALMNDSAFQCRTVRVSDRFGDYGLVGLLLVDLDSTAPRIDTFLLSCRVLGRGVEHGMLAEAGRLVSQAGGENIAVELFRTEKNTPALMFLRSVLDESFLDAGGEGIQASVPALTLADCVYEPASVAAPTDETSASEASVDNATTDYETKRDREDQIAATLQMSQLAMSNPVVEGRETSIDGRSVEDVVLKVFSNFLNQNPVTIREIDKLEELGCDSLMIVEITVALRKQFPDLPATLLFEHPSVVSIIDHIDGLDASKRIPNAGHRRRAGKLGSQDEQMIAVTGMSIRTGGATSLQEFESMLRNGRDAVVQVDEDARDFLGDFEGGPYFASLIDDAARFDAEFFNIIPREATYMDPQVRQFLEVAWSAIEDAGLAGSRRDPETGVYVGLMYGEYRAPANAQARREGSPLRSWEAFSLANRLSQFMNFTGPSLAIDTACSSSGTAIHMACKALAIGECRTAVVGGVNLAVDPDRFRQLNKLGILSPDGLCRPFGDTANGTVLGEGVGSVVLRRLDDAVEAGDRIYGLIRGSALSVGAGSVGFTAPNPVAQSIAISEAIADAGVDPRSVSYVECHGTGTALGDPIEVRGIELAYRDRSLWHEHTQGDQRVALGSVKANVGHLEAGAGVVSLIKVLLQLHTRTLFPTLSSDEPNPQIPLDKLGYRVQRECEPWQPARLVVNGEETTMPLRAGVNSFGVGGSNVHMIVEEYVAPVSAESAWVEPPVQVLPLSATGSDALARQAVAVRQALAESPPTRLSDFCYSMGTSRPQLSVRASIAAQNIEQLMDGLEKLSDPVRNRKARTPQGGQLVGLFSGQGSQYVGMGAELYKTSQVFRETIDECADYIDGFRDHPLQQVMFDASLADGELIHQTAYTQPALFALEVGLFRFFRELGVTPSIVCGHSVGEISALCAAGGVSLQDGLRLIEARGRLMQKLSGDCGMLAVAINEDDARELVSLHAAEVSIAAINGPESIVLAGSNSILAELAAQLASRSIKSTALKVSHGFHSPQMEGMLSTYRETIRSISFQTPEISIISCVSGTLLGDELFTEDYWMQQVRNPVQYFRAINGIAESASNIFMEFGPQPILLGMARRFLADKSQRWVASLQPRQPDELATMAAIGELFEAGATIDWRLIAGKGARRIEVPPYRFSDTQFWLDPLESGSLVPALVKRKVAKVPDAANYCLKWVETTLPANESDQAGSVHWLAETSAGQFPPGTHEQPDNLQPMSSNACWDVLKAAVDTGDVASVVLVFDAVETSSDTDSDSTSDSMLLRSRLNFLLRALKIVVEADCPSKIFVCTAGASPAIHGLSKPSSVDSALWAAARNIALEHPDNWGGLVCRGTAGADWFQRVMRLTRVDWVEDQWLCGQQEQLYVLRLVAAENVPVEGSITVDSGSHCLVLGGQGAIGLATAHWLVARGARKLVLTGRSAELGEQAKALVAQMAKVGGVVEFEQVDLSLAAGVNKLFDQYSSGSRRIGVVVHCAGVDDVQPALQTSAEVIDRQFGAKVLGGMVLRNKIEQIRPDLVILNSSISAVLGSQGRAIYAAANGYLDGLAEVLAEQGIRTVSVQWGPWGGGGLATQDSLEQLERMGNHALVAEPAMQCLERALQAGFTQTTVVAMDWPKFRSVFEMRKERPVLSELGITPPEVAVQGLHNSAAPWRQQMATVSAVEQRQLLLGLVQGAIATLLGHSDVQNIDCDQPFPELGIDSLLAIEMAASIEEGFGEFQSAAIFDYASVDELTGYLMDEYHKSPDAAFAADGTKRLLAATPTTRQDLEQMVATQAAEVLGVNSVEQLDISLSFAELGLDSLLMVELAGRLESALNVELALSDIFEQSSVAGAVSYLDQLLLSQNDTPTKVASVDASAPKPHTVLGHTQGVASAFEEFTRRAWPDRNPNLASARYQWMFVDSAQRTGTAPATWRIEADGGIAAFQGAMPVIVKLGNQTKCLPWLMDSMVLPDYRQQAFGARILMASREEFPLNLSLGQSDDMRAMQDRLNWQKVCTTTSYVLPLRPSDMLGNKVGKPKRLVYSAGAHLSFQARRFTRTRSHELKAIEVQHFDERFDDLWTTLSDQFECAVVRDASYLNWKYVDQPGQNYVCLSFEDAVGSLRGYAIVKLQEPNNIYTYRRATIIDLLAPFSEESIVFAMLDEVRARALDQGASAIQFHFSHETLHRTTLRYGFFDRGASEQFRIAANVSEAGELEMLVNGKNWLINKGDSDFDRPDPDRSLS